MSCEIQPAPQPRANPPNEPAMDRNANFGLNLVVFGLDNNISYMIINQALLMLSEFFLSEGTGLPPTKLYCDSHRWTLKLAQDVIRYVHFDKDKDKDFLLLNSTATNTGGL